MATEREDTADLTPAQLTEAKRLNVLLHQLRAIPASQQDTQTGLSSSRSASSRTQPLGLISTPSSPRACRACGQSFQTTELTIGPLPELGAADGRSVYCLRHYCDDCVLAERSRESADRRRQDQEMYRERLREAGLADWMLQKTWASFLVARDPDSHHQAKWFVNQIMASPALWLGLWSERTGAGKTHLALAVTIQTCQNLSAVFLTAHELMVWLRRSYAAGGPSEWEQEQRLVKPDLLVIDDVGAERKSEYVAETYLAVLNARYNRGKAVMLTTNLDPDQLKGHLGAKCASRLSERGVLHHCTPVPTALVGGPAAVDDAADWRVGGRT